MAAKKRSRKQPAHRDPVDEHAATELVMYIENTSDLSPDGPSGQGRSVLLNALRKWRNKTYDSEKAVRLFEYLTEAGAKRYAKEFDSEKNWATMFNPATRHEAAKQLEASFRSSAEHGEYDHVDTRIGVRENVEEHVDARGKTRLDKLRADLPPGYVVYTYSPGDGVTRYRFFKNASPKQDYFGPDNGIYTALGYSEAEAFASGLVSETREVSAARSDDRPISILRRAVSMYQPAQVFINGRYQVSGTITPTHGIEAEARTVLGITRPGDVIEVKQGENVWSFTRTEDGISQSSHRFAEEQTHVAASSHLVALRWSSDGVAQGRYGTYRLRKTNYGWTVLLNDRQSLGEWASPDKAKMFAERYDAEPSNFSDEARLAESGPPTEMRDGPRKLTLGKPERSRSGFGPGQYTVERTPVFDSSGREVGAIQRRFTKKRAIDSSTTHHATRSAVRGIDLAWLERQEAAHSGGWDRNVSEDPRRSAHHPIKH